MSKARDLADGTFDTDTLVVDAANNRVGIGTASPTSRLQLDGAEDRTGGLTLSAGGQNHTYFLSSDFVNVHNIETSSGAAAHTWQTNGTERLRIDSDKLVVIGNLTTVDSNAPTYRGNIVIGDSGGGIGQDGGIEIMQSSGGGAGYGVRYTATTSEGLSLQSRSNASSWTEVLQVSNNGSMISPMFFAGNSEYVGDMDDLKKSGFYRAYNGNSNLPSAHYYAVVVFGNNGNVTSQIAVRLQSSISYARSFNTSWSAWGRLDT